MIHKHNLVKALLEYDKDDTDDHSARVNLCRIKDRYTNIPLK